jgi:hypothetical protein
METKSILLAAVIVGWQGMNVSAMAATRFRGAMVDLLSITQHVIIVEPAYGRPEELPHVPKLPLNRVLYSIHMYGPGAFTHQGLFGRRTGVRYISATDKVKLRRIFHPVAYYLSFSSRRGEVRGEG